MGETQYTLRLLCKVKDFQTTEVVYVESVKKRVIKVDTGSHVDYYFDLVQDDIPVLKWKT